MPNAQDEAFLSSFENVYNHTVFKDTPFYQILGNHDYRGNIDAQIQYSQQNPNSNFKLPARFYAVSMALNKQNKVSFDVQTSSHTSKQQQDDATMRVKFVFTDTSPMFSKYYQDKDMNQTELQRAVPSHVQAQFIKEQLRQGQGSDYQFIVAHHPTYSAELKHGMGFSYFSH